MSRKSAGVVKMARPLRIEFPDTIYRAAVIALARNCNTTDELLEKLKASLKELWRKDFLAETRESSVHFGYACLASPHGSGSARGCSRMQAGSLWRPVRDEFVRFIRNHGATGSQISRGPAWVHCRKPLIPFTGHANALGSAIPRPACCTWQI